MSLPNAVIIPHGATEDRLAKWVAESLRTRVVVHRQYDVERTVSMKSIGAILEGRPFDTDMALHKAYPELDYASGRRKLVGLTLIPILDVDRDRLSFASYKSGDLFSRIPLGRGCVLPIYNDPNLEEVLWKAGYGRVEHDLLSFTEFLDSIDINDFEERMARCPDTNMEEFIRRLKKHVPSFQV